VRGSRARHNKAISSGSPGSNGQLLLESQDEQLPLPEAEACHSDGAIATNSAHLSLLSRSLPFSRSRTYLLTPSPSLARTYLPTLSFFVFPRDRKGGKKRSARKCMHAIALGEPEPKLVGYHGKNL